MAYRRFHYRWQWQLQASPDALWPLASDTNSFNRDAGVPELEIGDTVGSSGTRRLRFTRFGIGVEWDEEPFEWVRPWRFGVVRRYVRGPVAEMRVEVELTPRDGGTTVTYEVWAEPRNLLGLVAIPLEIGRRSRRRFEQTFRRYDRLALDGATMPGSAVPAELAPGGRQRIGPVRERLVTDGADPTLVDRLVETVTTGDELALGRLRPYALADAWGVPRRTVLELCLRATRAGLLDLGWDVLCPLCRGPQQTGATLNGVSRDVHCDSCRIDFGVNFEYSVELSFRPNAAVRAVERQEFCVGGPQVTPHIVLQQLLQPGERRVVSPAFEPGRYRLRARGVAGHEPVLVADEGGERARIALDGNAWPPQELRLAPKPALELVNESGAAQLLMLDRAAWGDDAATAADVTALQMFRDLFSAEALRPREPISVGNLAVLFTDLRDSTRFYRDVGDAPAFGSVMQHLDVLRDAIVAEDGAVVKTMGDAVMAIFRRPAGAVRAALAAQRELADGARSNGRPHWLKVGIHVGPCIAVDQNERLDYFGSTVNAAARLVSLSSGQDVVVSGAVRADPEVSELLADANIAAEPLEAELKGFDDRFELWRLAER